MQTTADTIDLVLRELQLIQLASVSFVAARIAGCCGLVNILRRSRDARSSFAQAVQYRIYKGMNMDISCKQIVILIATNGFSFTDGPAFPARYVWPWPSMV